MSMPLNRIDAGLAGNPLVLAIQRRISANRFDPTRQVSDARIAELVGLATRAPTAFNLQNWRFIAVRTPEAKQRLRKVAQDQAKVTDAAVVYIVCGQPPCHETLAARLQPAVAAGFMPPEMPAIWVEATKASYENQPQKQRDEAIRSASFGAAMLILAAEAHGLASCVMGGFDPAGVAHDFGLAADEIPVVLVAIGFAAAGNWPQKPRRPVADMLAFV